MKQSVFIVSACIVCLSLLAGIVLLLDTSATTDNKSVQEPSSSLLLLKDQKETNISNAAQDGVSKIIIKDKDNKGADIRRILSGKVIVNDQVLCKKNGIDKKCLEIPNTNKSKP